MRLLLHKKHIVIKGFFLLLSVLCITVNVADCAERIYYSIHFASFKNLQNAHTSINAMKKKGKMVFWKKTNIPGKGIFYRVYFGKYENYDDALKNWKKLKKDGVVSYLGIHESREEVEPVKIKKKLSPVIRGKLDTVQPSSRKQKENRFLDNHDGTVTDTKFNLMWIKNGWRLDFFSAVDWRTARKKCNEFKHGGYTNWRLPTIEEWSALVDANRQFPALVEPNPFENIIVHMPYWSNTDFIYGPKHTCITKCPIHAYTIMLYSGAINRQSKNRLAFILPVRSID